MPEAISQGRPLFYIPIHRALREITSGGFNIEFSDERMKKWGRDFSESVRNFPVDVGGLTIGYVEDVKTDEESIGLILKWSQDITIATYFGGS